MLVRMACFTPGMDWQLAASLAGDADLLDELRTALRDDARHYGNLLGRSRCDANWIQAATRLHGLAASFGAHALQRAAALALEFAPGDPVALRAVLAAIAALEPCDQQPR
jgi:HPt (histidine-containing phosphotransfer) domain-containing protein